MMQQTMTVSVLSPVAILLVGLVAVGLIAVVIGLVAMAGKHGAKIVLGVVAAGMVGLGLLCAGLMFISVPSRTVISRQEAVSVIHDRPVARVSSQFETTAVRSGSATAEIEHFPRDLSQAASEPTTEDGVAATGKSIGQLAGSIYQEFRNQLKSGDLSVDPSRIIPPGRPAWVEQPPRWEQDGIYYVSVSSGPYDRGMECSKSLDREVTVALQAYANDLLSNNQAGTMLAAELENLKEEVVAENYQEQLTPSFGVMHQWHALLKFDPAIQQKIRDLWSVQKRISRVIYIGTGFLFLIGLMSVAYIGLALTRREAKVSPWLVSAGTVFAVSGLLVAGVIFVRSFPML